jgi:uncharacterized protein (DUF302 family)
VSTDTSNRLAKLIEQDLAETEARVTAALATEGFGVLTRIDVSETLRNKIGAEIEEYVILGACNPPLAHRALEHSRRVGLLLPCNVVLRAVDGGTQVEAVDPRTLLPADDQAMCDLADDAAGRLSRAISAAASA